MWDDFDGSESGSEDRKWIRGCLAMFGLLFLALTLGAYFLGRS